MRHLLFALALLTACGGESPQSKQRATTSPQAGPRTMITRPLMQTSPQNLLRDPAVSGNSSFIDAGSFTALAVKPNQSEVAFFDTFGQPLRRIYQSASPVGGTKAITELAIALQFFPAGATSVKILSSFMGGPGAFHASVWISAGAPDQTGAVRFVTAETALSVWLLGVDGTNKVQLQPAETTVTYGDREWIQYSTAGDASVPFLGWFEVELTNLHLSLQLASPEVTSSALGGPSAGLSAPRVAMTGRDLQAIAQLRRTLPAGTRRFPRPDRAPR